jgi:glycosyltransferase involved in cell wall biosynthesis
LTHAARVSKIDRVLFHHRRARKGQTSFNFNQPDGESADMSMEWFRRYTSVAKIGGYFPNQFGIGRGLFPETSVTGRQEIDCLPPVAQKEVATTYFEWLKASAWIGKKQITRQMREKFFRRLDQVRHHWAGQEDIIVPEGYWLALDESVSLNRITRPKEIDLSIIMPTVNVAEFLYDLLDSMYAELFKPGFTFEVFAIDDGSTDNTADILRDFADDHKHNFYFMSTAASNGAGKARNLALPLVEGRYVYLVDADDVYDFGALVEAVDFATKYKKDIMVMPYFVEFVGPDKQTKREGMMKGDDLIWTSVRAQSEKTHLSQKEAALGLINYPWKQLTSSKLLFDADVFFGPTKVHNDVQFHWTSIAASKNIHFYHKEVCSHRKFDSSVRSQLTEVKNEARMSVFASLGMTQRALAKNGAFDGEEGENIVFPQWRNFAIHLLKWAKSRIPKESKTLYMQKQAHLLNILGNNATKPSELRKWSYWGERFAPMAQKTLGAATA